MTVVTDTYEPVEEFGGIPLEIPISLTELTKGVSYTDPAFPLQITRQTKHEDEDRPILHSTKWQRLAYYRGYSATPAKTEIIATKNVELNNFLWLYALNVFFKSLPHGFVHFFIASYAPEEHMFVTKMVPIFHGLKYLFVIVGLFELSTNLDMILMLFHYGAEGVLYRNPWNRCRNRTYFDPILNNTMHCYDFDEFIKKFVNTSNIMLESSYLSPENEHFQVSQIEYYRGNIHKLATSWNITDFLFMWSLIHFAQLVAHKKIFWQILDRSQLGINVIDVVTYIYLALLHLNDNPRDILHRNTTLRQGEEDEPYLATDLEMLAESITAPPIVHVLTSRSNQEIKPTTDSAVMVISNAVVYIFRGLLSNKVKTHCEILVGAEISFINFNEHSWFYYWPMFFARFYLGDVCSVFYVTLNCVCEFSIMVVTYRCILETVVCEWPKIKRWMMSIASFVIGIVIYCTTSADTRAVFWVYGKGIATLAETVSIYYLYPVGRLVDDFTYHYGEPPTKLRILSMKLVPIYYMFKVYVMFRGMWNTLEVDLTAREVSHYPWSWSLWLLPIIIGNLYIIYKYIYVYRMTWPYLFRPLMKWGPKEFSVRQLRKRFDSRFFIASHVPRLLSRYLVSKRDANVLKVDVKYDFARRSTVSPLMGVRFTDH